MYPKLITIGTPSSPTNFISTRRYTWVTFLPLSLLSHFAKYSNCYLLLTALIMLIPDVTPLSPLSALGPLLFVLLVSQVRVFLEELLAHKRDSNLNNLFVSRYSPCVAQATKIKWSEITPGDVLMLPPESEVPCDCIVMRGHCKVDASKLDGESLLRQKQPLLSAASCATENWWGGVIQLNANTPDLYKFNALFATSADATKDAIEATVEDAIEAKEVTINELILRGTVVKEEEVVVVAVYCGKETKTELNAEKKKAAKWTRMDAVIDGTVLALLGLQLLASAALAVKRKGKEHWYLGKEGGIGKAFLTGMILLASLVPASLWVAREVIRLVVAVRIETKDIGCNSKTLHDELGNVSHILTDKTGTLTTNRMQIAALVASITHSETTETPRKYESAENFQIFQSHFSESIQSNLFSCILAPDASLVSSIQSSLHPPAPSDLLSDSLTESELLLWLNLCFNHTCTLERASSPDEAAIVSLAHALGLPFTADPQNSPENLSVLKIFEFTPERRMMTVVIGNSSRVFVLTKGADSALFAYIAKNEDRNFLGQIVDNLCLDGLRVLVLGGRAMARSVWNAQNCTEAELLSKDFKVVGCVGLRDALQEDVAETLRVLREAQIAVSMATGDKKETAVGVALSCGLLARDAAIFAASDTGDFRLIKAGTGAALGVVVEGGPVLTKLLKEEKKLTAILARANGAVFCRVTPGEKARLVELMQKHASVLAVGDGGNDVSMLLKANVGVGISAGLEGNQAANAADYTVKKFSDLRVLLFVHGTSILKRFTIFNKLFLFKNFILTICQFLFFPFSGFSGQTVFDDWYLLGYNSVFCLLPLMVAACETSPVSSYRTEAAEYVNVRKNAFSGKSIFLWFLRGLGTSFVLLHSTTLAMAARPDGTTNDFVFFSVLLYTQLLLLVSVLTLTHAKFSWWFLALLLVYNLGMYALFVFVYDHIIWNSEKWRMKHVAVTIFSDLSFWLTSALTVSALTIAEHAHRTWWRPYGPSKL